MAAEVAHRSVNHEAGDAGVLGRECHHVAPGAGFQKALGIDHQDVPGLGDGQGVMKDQVVGGLGVDSESRTGHEERRIERLDPAVHGAPLALGLVDRGRPKPADDIDLFGENVLLMIWLFSTW